MGAHRFVVRLGQCKEVPIGIANDNNVKNSSITSFEFSQVVASLDHPAFLALTPIGRDLPVGFGAVVLSSVNPPNSSIASLTINVVASPTDDHQHGENRAVMRSVGILDVIEGFRKVVNNLMKTFSP